MALKKENDMVKKIRKLNIGEKFGELVVLAYGGKNKHRQITWLCRCKCGKEILAHQWNLVVRGQKNCGCVGNYKHGLKGTRFYAIWTAIKSRCENKNNSAYAYYGGRGIKVEWSNSEEFARDMHESYLSHEKEHGTKDTTIERVDNNGNYSKENCRWATREEQNKNKKNTRFVIYNGERIVMRDLSKILGLDYEWLRTRVYKLGRTVEQAIAESKV